MIEVHPGLFVGDEADERVTRGAADWFVVHACKEPFHRAALGYEGRGAPQGHPEYLVAYRPGCVILNLIDAPESRMIRPEVIAAGVQAIADNLLRSRVLVHCNQGRSRSPVIAMLYLALHTDLFDTDTYDTAAARFAALYPPFAPAAGMEQFAQQVWHGEIDLPAQSWEPPAPTPTEPAPAERSQPRVLFSM
jgi:hypothetical protein